MKKTGMCQKRSYTTRHKEGTKMGWQTCDIIKSHILLGGWPTNWRRIIFQRFSHRHESSEPHITLSAQGYGNGKIRPKSIWLWRPVGFFYRSPTGLGELETAGRAWQSTRLGATKPIRQLILSAYCNRRTHTALLGGTPRVYSFHNKRKMHCYDT